MKDSKKDHSFLTTTHMAFGPSGLRIRFSEVGDQTKRREGPLQGIANLVPNLGFGFRVLSIGFIGLRV